MPARNLFRCLHLEMSSDLLLRCVPLSASRMQSFSLGHKLQRANPALKAGACLTIDHSIMWLTSLSFNSQTHFDRAVSFVWLLVLNDDLCPV